MKGLKKALSIIALVVLIWTDFLNPISYAIEQEEVIFWVEENIELENENEEENIDEINGEDIEEEEDEVEEIEEFVEIAEETVESIEDVLSWEDYVEEENKESGEIGCEEELEENTGLFVSELNEYWDVEQNVVEKWNDEEVEEMDETVDNEDDLDWENSLIEKNKELDGGNNIEKLNMESALEIYDQEKEKLEINDMLVNNVKTVEWTLLKENWVTYVFADDVTFDGTNYINTDLKLFSSSFWKKDFDISFNVDSITAFNPNQNSNRNNIMHIINEKGNPFQGFDLRLEGNKDSYKWQIRAVSEKDEFTLNNSTLTSSSFRFRTENNVLHYYDNGNDITSQDFSSTVSFEWPLMFWAALDGTKKPFRYFKWILSDVTVYVAYDNWDKITLPSPTSPDKIFLGWYTDANFIHQVTLDANGKYTVGQNETLYARWVNYKVTIRSNEYWQIIKIIL